MDFQAKTIKELSKKIDALISVFGDDIRILATGCTSAKVHTRGGQRVMDSKYEIEHFHDSLIYHHSFKGGVIIEKCDFIWNTYSVSDILNLSFTVKK